MDAQDEARFQSVKNNQKLLDSCKQHKFLIPQDGIGFGQKLSCVRCTGTLNAIHAFYYTMGFEAAGGNPNDVVENFRTILPK